MFNTVERAKQVELFKFNLMLMRHGCVHPTEALLKAREQLPYLEQYHVGHMRRFDHEIIRDELLTIANHMIEQRIKSLVHSKFMSDVGDAKMIMRRVNLFPEHSPTIVRIFMFAEPGKELKNRQPLIENQYYICAGDEIEAIPEDCVKLWYPKSFEALLNKNSKFPFPRDFKDLV